MLRTKDYYSTTDDRLRLVNRLRDARPYLAMAMLVTAVIGLVINLAGQRIELPAALARAYTHPATALCLSMLATAVYLTPESGRSPRILPYLKFGSGSLALLYFSIAHFGLDPLAAMLPVRGQMSMDSCIAIILMTLSIRFRSRLPLPGLICLCAFLAIVMNSVIGLTFGVTYFDGQMGPMTLISLCFGAICTVSLHADHPSIRIILLNSGVGTRTRVMVMVGTIVPWAAGMFLYRVWGVPDSTYHIEAVMISAIIMSTNTIAIVSGYQHQIADDLRSRAEQRLSELAVTDALTRLRNRAGLTQIMRRRMADLRHTERPVGLVMFDLDHFKTINDTHGHDEGDRVLVNVGRAVQPLLRQGDVLGRWGGEEFILVADMRHPDELAQLVERLRIAVHDISRQTGAHCKTGAYIVSASFGVSYMRPDDHSFNDAVKRADQALYEAKSLGRNRVIFAREDTRAA